jgi:SSS family solute:Na+ symporter
LLNSSSTIASIDIYQRLIKRDASEKSIVLLGRVLTVVFVVIGCITAPLLTDGVFGFIQQFQGFIWPGVVAAFLGAFLLPRAPAAAGLTALLLGPVAYSFFQLATKQGLFAKVLDNPLFEMHYLTQVLCSFAVVSAAMIVLTLVSPLAKPRKLPVREDIALTTDPIVKAAAVAVITAVAVLFFIFR